jgi:hypothetical protein
MNNEDFSHDGELLSVDDLAADFKVSTRQVQIFHEEGRIKFFKMGRLLRTTQAERDRFVRQLIKDDAERQNALVNGD